VRVRVKVIPRAKKEKVIEEGQTLKVYLTQPAQEGRANQGLRAVLARHFSTKKYNITIVKGEHSREKIIQIRKTG